MSITTISNVAANIGAMAGSTQGAGEGDTSASGFAALLAAQTQGTASSPLFARQGLLPAGHTKGERDFDSEGLLGQTETDPALMAAIIGIPYGQTTANLPATPSEVDTLLTGTPGITDTTGADDSRNAALARIVGEQAGSGGDASGPSSTAYQEKETGCFTLSNQSSLEGKSEAASSPVGASDTGGRATTTIGDANATPNGKSLGATPQATLGMPTATENGQSAGHLAEQATRPANIAADPTPPGIQTAISAQIANGVRKNDEATAHAIPQSIHSSQWASGLGEKVVWMARNDQQSAQININPPQLGPLTITLNLQGDQASAAFTSPHPEVRQAIESSLPQLREMLSASGITLGDTNVGANLAQQQQNTPFTAANRNPAMSENAILPANESVANTTTNHVTSRGRGLVDLFA